MLGWIGPGFSCSSPEYRGHSGGPVDINILGRGRLESGGGRAPGPLALNMYIPGGSVASRISLKWLQICYDPEDKLLKGNCDVCTPLYTCSVSELSSSRKTMPGDHCDCHQAPGCWKALILTLPLQHRQQQYTSQAVKLAQPDII